MKDNKFSSFPKQQKLFENWRGYLNEQDCQLREFDVPDAARRREAGKIDVPSHWGKEKKTPGAGAAEVRRAQAYKGKGGSGQVKDVKPSEKSVEASKFKTEPMASKTYTSAAERNMDLAAKQLRDEGASFKSTAEANAAVKARADELHAQMLQQWRAEDAAELAEPEAPAATGPEEPAAPAPATTPRKPLPGSTSGVQSVSRLPSHGRFSKQGKPKHTSKSWNAERRGINADLKSGKINKAEWRKRRRANWKLMPSRTKKRVTSRRAAKERAPAVVPAATEAPAPGPEEPTAPQPETKAKPKGLSDKQKAHMADVKRTKFYSDTNPLKVKAEPWLQKHTKRAELKARSERTAAARAKLDQEEETEGKAKEMMAPLGANVGAKNIKKRRAARAARKRARASRKPTR